MATIFQKIREKLQELLKKLPRRKQEPGTEPDRQKRAKKKKPRTPRPGTGKSIRWRKAVRRSLHAVIALLLVAVILISFTFTSLVEITKRLPQVHLTAEELKKRNGGTLRMRIVYSEDSFAEAAAQRLAKKCNAVEGLTAIPMPELSVDADAQQSDLVVFLGQMRMDTTESYFTAFRRIGSGGLELRHDENTEDETIRVDILAFSESQMNRGVDKFVSYFLSTGGTFGNLGTVFGTEPEHAEGEIPGLYALQGTTFRSCTLAYPGTDGYSLRATGTLLRELQPDSLTLWGVPDLGFDRGTIAAGWEKVMSVLPAGLDMNVLPAPTLGGAEKTGITLDILPMLLPEQTGRIRTVDCRFLLGPDGEPVGAEYWLTSPEEENILLLSAQMRQYSALLRRACGENLPQILYLSAIPAAIAEQLPGEYDYVESNGMTFFEPYDTCVSSSADGIFRTAAECGVQYFVCNAGYSDVGVLHTEWNGYPVTVGFCGSIGFQNPGVGGRFALNNSLRGMLLFSLEGGRGKTVQAKMQYVPASAYGLTEKNAGE